jgi:hypothetical protein
MTQKKYIIMGEIAAFLCMFFADLRSALLAVGFLIMADTFTGIFNAWQKGVPKYGFLFGWRNVESRKMGRIIIKLILYPLALIVAKVAGEYLLPEIPWVRVTSGILAVIEVRSIFENIGKILGYDLWDRMKKAIWKHKHEDTK